jgi:alpha-maltose-1-phosphate synthase
MKVLLLHPGTQYSAKLALQLNRLGLLNKFITGIGFTPSDWLWRIAPAALKRKLANRILDASITPDQVINIFWPELIAWFRLNKNQSMEKVLYERNRQFQNAISSRFLKESDSIIGFDTSSWIVAGEAKRLSKPFFHDQSIAHPIEKLSIFENLRTQYPEWIEDIPEKESPLLQLEKEEHDLATAIVVASTFTRNSLIKAGVSSSKIRMNPYGVGHEFFFRKTNNGNIKTRFVYLGTLGARKGLPFLLESWIDGELYQKAELWLAGPASEVAIKAVDKVPGVRYLGRLPFNKIPSLLDSCDALVFPSFFEGFGQVILEAMAAGLPVITTDATAGPDIIENGWDGFCFPAGQRVALSNSLITLATDQRLCHEMGTRAREKARAFSWESYGDRWKNIIFQK